MNKIKQFWLFLFGFQGKITRKHYIIFLLLWLPILILLWFLSAIILIFIGEVLKINFIINYGWMLFVILFLFSLPIIHSYITRRNNAINKLVWLKTYSCILWAHIILGGVVCLVIYMPPALVVISFYIFALIPMISIAFYKDKQ